MAENWEKTTIRKWDPETRTLGEPLEAKVRPCGSYAEAMERWRVQRSVDAAYIGERLRREIDCHPPLKIGMKGIVLFVVPKSVVVEDDEVTVKMMVSGIWSKPEDKPE